MKLVDTRDESLEASFKEALLNPASKTGGLYAPKNLPSFKGEDFKDLTYTDFALKLIQSFEFGEDESFKKALKTYESFDDSTCPIHIRKVDEKLFVNELYHGPTRAFKDMALQPFGVLLQAFSEGKNFLIICATSGDTGPATLKSFENANKIKVACIYPDQGTSRVQALQMKSLEAKNLKILPISGDFDEAQNALKALLNDEDFKNSLKLQNTELSAANSVNFGRILFQIIYHYYATLELGEIDIIIPSGNFGDALGAYYAKKMGAKIARIKIASNANNILTEFFTKGEYDLRGKKLIKTISPAMDILISSNIERLIFDKFGSKRTNELFTQLKTELFFKLEKAELEALKEDFDAAYCDDKECMAYIKDFTKNSLIDPHTATCLKLLDKNKKTLITATAEWIKFTPSMYEALFDKKCADEKQAMIEIAEHYGVGIKTEIFNLFKTEDKNHKVYASHELKNAIIKWLKQ